MLFCNLILFEHFSRPIEPQALFLWVCDFSHEFADGSFAVYLIGDSDVSPAHQITHQFQSPGSLAEVHRFETLNALSDYCLNGSRFSLFQQFEGGDVSLGLCALAQILLCEVLEEKFEGRVFFVVALETL